MQKQPGNHRLCTMFSRIFVKLSSRQRARASGKTWCAARESIRLTLLLAALALPSACSSKSSEQTPKELVKNKATAADAPQEELLENAQRFYAKGLYTIARDSFESLKNLYPVGPYAEFAELKTADCYYQLSEFENAAILYENFVKDHPGSASEPYALLMAGKAYQRAYSGLGRDPLPLEKGMEIVERLLQLHPESPYAHTALPLQKKLVDGLMAHEQFVIDFYRRVDAEQAVQNRLQAYREKWDPILKKLADSEAADEQRQEQQPARPAAPRVVSAMKGTAPESRASSAEKLKTKRLTLLNCKDNTVTFVVDGYSVSDLEDLMAEQQLEPVNGAVRLQIPGADLGRAKKDCFGKADLEFAADTVSINTTSPVVPMVLDRPARLLLFLR